MLGVRCSDAKRKLSERECAMKRVNISSLLQNSPVLKSALNEYAGRTVQRLLGFWMLWHACGGLDGLIASGYLSRSNAYLQRMQFLTIFKIDVEDFLPEYGSKFYRDQEGLKES